MTILEDDFHVCINVICISSAVSSSVYASNKKKHQLRRLKQFSDLSNESYFCRSNLKETNLLLSYFARLVVFLKAVMLSSPSRNPRWYLTIDIDVLVDIIWHFFFYTVVVMLYNTMLFSSKEKFEFQVDLSALSSSLANVYGSVCQYISQVDCSFFVFLNNQILCGLKYCSMKNSINNLVTTDALHSDYCNWHI